MTLRRCSAGRRPAPRSTRACRSQGGAPAGGGLRDDRRDRRRARGGRVGRRHGGAAAADHRGVSATVPADRLVELSRKPGVSAVTKDRQAKLYAASWDESLTASSYVWNSGATAAWAAGARGTGVGVAVLDTGISSGNDHAGRVVHGPDLSGEGRHDVDTFGHGTVMGGIVGGNGVDGGATPRTGIAPGAHLVSVKVAGANGATDVSTVLAGMHWVAAFKDTYNIRVMSSY